MVFLNNVNKKIDYECYTDYENLFCSVLLKFVLPLFTIEFTAITNTRCTIVSNEKILSSYSYYEIPSPRNDNILCKYCSLFLKKFKRYQFVTKTITGIVYRGSHYFI